MISTPDRQKVVALINEAYQSGARRRAACRELGVSLGTYQRWTSQGTVEPDRRPTAVRAEPSNKLSAEERARVLRACHRPEFASLPPGQIVPRLADQGEYLASESTFYRVLRQADEQHARGRARAPHKPRPPASHCAKAPCEVWSWDITWLPGPLRGAFFYLYLIMDLYSRKIVGWEIHERESAEQAAALVRRAVLAEGCVGKPLVLHADNGSARKGSTLRATLEAPGVLASYSRPRVSDDNPFSEAVFRTCKYRPDYPYGGFESLEAARTWVLKFVHWYNRDHRHSAIRYVTPIERHERQDTALLAQRKALYEAAKARHPNRWSGPTRNWQPIAEVWLNPQPDRRTKEISLPRAA
jgi:putative transposase